MIYILLYIIHLNKSNFRHLFYYMLHFCDIFIVKADAFSMIVVVLVGLSKSNS